jgi:hypothetical protein
VFGEKGALFEHVVFDVFFNRPRMIGAWGAKHARWLLTGWLLLGMTVWWTLLALTGAGWDLKIWINSVLILIFVFVFPRVVFYPALKSTRSRSQS